MKILKKVDVNEWKHNFTCDDCDSSLEANASDVKYVYHDGMGRESNYEEYLVDCPVCGESKTLDEVNLPKLVKLTAKNPKAPHFDVRDSNDR